MPSLTIMKVMGVCVVGIVAAWAVLTFGPEWDEMNHQGCIRRSGTWNPTWKVCAELSELERCARFCEARGLAFKSYKNGCAAFQDERCECEQRYPANAAERQ